MPKKNSGSKRAAKVQKRTKKKKAAKRTSTKVLLEILDRQQRREKADDLYERAANTKDYKTAMNLLAKAVEVDPGHIDSLIVLAGEEPDLADSKALLQTAIRHGRKELQDELKNHRGHFWGLWQTRPFMRAKLALAHLHRGEGNLDATAEIMEEMLELNEADSQGVRWDLMEVYLRLDRVDDAEQLWKRFDDDLSPFLRFTSLVVRLRKYGDSPELRQDLIEQAETNPHIIPRILDPQLISTTEHTMFSRGSEQEADLYCQKYLFSWKSTPGAITWLRAAANSQNLSIYPLIGDESDFDIKKEIQRLRKQVKELPNASEAWYADVSNVPGDTPLQDSWLLTVIDCVSEDAILIEPGEGNEETPDGVMYSLLMAMLNPDFGEPRRPDCIFLFDAVLQKKLAKRFDRLDIELAMAESRPEILNFMEKGNLGFTGQIDVDFDELRSLPRLAHSWIIDWKQLPILVPGDDGNPSNPVMMLVLDHGSGAILSQQLLMQQPTEDDLALVVQQAAQFDQFPEPALPEAIVVRSADNRESVAFLHDKINVPIEVGDCNVANNAFDGLAGHLEQTTTGVPSLLDACEGEISLVGDFYDIANEFFKSKVWLTTAPETVVRVSCEELLPGEWFGVVMGQSGQELGMIFFDSLKSLRAINAETDFDENPIAGEDYLRGISFSLDEQYSIHPDEVAAAEQFGWPVAAPEAWPTALQIKDASLLPVDAIQLRFLPIAIQASLSRLKGKVGDGTMEVDLNDEVFSVSVSVVKTP